MEAGKLRRIPSHRSQQPLENRQVDRAAPIGPCPGADAFHSVEEVHLSGVLVEERQKIPEEAFGVPDECSQQVPVSMLRHPGERHWNDELTERAALVLQFEGQKATDGFEAGLETHLEELHRFDPSPVPSRGQRPAVDLGAIDGRNGLG